MKILALNSVEQRKKKILERLISKYSDKDRVPTAYERFKWLVNFLVPYFRTLKTIMTVVTPCKRPSLNLNQSADLDLVCEEHPHGSARQGPRRRLPRHLLPLERLRPVLLRGPSAADVPAHLLGPRLLNIYVFFTLSL